MKNLLFIAFSCFTFIAFSNEVHWTKRYEGSNLTSSLQFGINDGDLALYNPSNTNFVSVSQLAYVRLGVQERVGITLNTSVSIVEADVTITPYSYSGGSWLAGSTINTTLTVEFNSLNNSVELDISDYRMMGIYKFDIEVTELRVDAVAVGSVPEYIYIESGIYSERYYAMDINATPILGIQLLEYDPQGQIDSITVSTTTSSSTDEIYVNWNYIEGAEYYDLEWTWVDNYSSSSLSSSIPIGSLSLTEQQFKNNCTRIRTKDQFYRIPQIFSKGYLVLRVRGVGRWLDATNKDLYGKWSSGTGNKVTVSNWPLTGVVSITSEHENGKNWQYQATYAEDGKKKEVAQYFDGSLRNRQAVTRINSKDQSVVGETVYDNEGRGVVQILPVPQNNPSIKYYPNISKNELDETYSHKNFDWQDSTIIACNSFGADPLSQNYGAGKYYSADGHNLETDWQQYVPESNGYPFTQVEYTPDNTGRIRSQSGVGETHTIGSGHQTDYYYLQPNQNELNRLFGYKVGYNSRYKKNMVVDANGQVSVSYLDAQGRVIATAMAGDNSTEFESLKSEDNSEFHNLIYTDIINKVNANDPNTEFDNNELYSTGRFGPNNDGLVINTQIGVISDGAEYDFAYDVETFWYSECQSQLIYPYVYDLTLSLQSDCGDEIFSVSYDSIVGIADIGQSINDNFSAFFETVQFPKRGTYTLVKKLEVNEASLELYLEHYLDDSLNPCLYDSTAFVVDVPTDCNTTCLECAEGLGSLEEYLMQAEVDFGSEYNESYSTNVYNALYEACLEPCKITKSCDVYRRMLMNDVSPGGQYCLPISGDPVSIITLGHWRGAAFISNSKNYLDEFGNLSYVLAYPTSNPVPGTTVGAGLFQHQLQDNGELPAMVEPWMLTLSDFQNSFQTSWAEELIEYHPEYALYEYAQEICSKASFGVLDKNSETQYYSSEEFDAILRNTITGYQSAKDNIYGINYIADSTDLLGPFYSIDPYFHQSYDVHDNVSANLQSWKNNLMIDEITDKYKSTNMTMFEFAAKTILCGNSLSSCSYTIPTSWNDINFTSLSPSLKDAITQQYKSYYLSRKGEINQLLMDLHGFDQPVGIFNGCIGSGGFQQGSLFPFMNNGPIFFQIYPFILNQWGWGPFGGFNLFTSNLPAYVPFNQTCLCSSYFNNKQIRITRIGALSNEGSSANIVISEASATADYEMWAATGLCPLTIDMERLLLKLATDTLLTSTSSMEEIHELVPDLYEAMMGVYPGSNINISGNISGSDLILEFDNGSNSCNITIPQLSNNTGSLQWNDFGSSWVIFNLSQSFPIQSTNDVTVVILAGPSLSAAQEYIVTYASCVDLNSCQADYASDNSYSSDCQKEKEFETALLNLIQEITLNGELGNAVDITSYDSYVGTILEDYLGTSSVTWDGTGSTATLFGSISGVSREFNLGINYSSFVQMVTSLDLFRPDGLLFTSTMEYNSSNSPSYYPNDLDGGYYYKVDNELTEMDFTCDCEESQFTQISLEVENLLNELFSIDDPEGLQPEALLEMTYLFEDVEQEISGFFNEFVFTPGYPNCISYSSHWWPEGSEGEEESEPCITIVVCDGSIKSENESKMIAVTNLTLNEIDFTFTADVMLSDGYYYSATGTISCITIPSCEECLPMVNEPISCTDSYESYTHSTEIGAIMGEFTQTQLDEYLLDQATFCNGSYAYILEAYLQYLEDFNITSVSNPLYLSITEFASTPLGTSNDLLSDAVTAYLTSDFSDPYNTDLEYLTWNEYVGNVYIDLHPEICPQPVPQAPFPDTLIEFPCNQWENNVATVNAQNQQSIYLGNKRLEFIKAYIEGAMSSVQESFYEMHEDKEYHYTLYYYDRAGNLIQTVPPKGVSRFEYDITGTVPDIDEDVKVNSQGQTGSNNATINSIRNQSPNETDLLNPQISSENIAPEHILVTNYKYNSLNQLVYQVTPDGGESRFAYDKLGRLIMSQNALQNAHDQFSYTRYDGLGRVIEVGEMTLVGYTINTIGRLELSGQEVQAVNDVLFPNNLSNDREEVTRTIYDELLGFEIPTSSSPVTVVNEFENYSVDNTRNRIVGVIYLQQLNPSDLDDNSSYANGTFYDYDVHGNVKELIQVNNDIALINLDQNIKKITYDYDLVSGNVKKVAYQPNSQDQFIHRYSYDDDNRITIAETSKDGFIWEKDAKYFYYDHGPLARTEIAEKKVQALDYAYTIQGWLKSVNGEEISSESMMGQDGKFATLNSQNAKDVFGYSLSYFENDYDAATTAMLNYTESGSPNLGASLFNGNIRSMHTALSDNDEYALATHQTNYTYDQLNRIKSMNGYNRNITSGISPSGYKSSYSFDENGNLETLKRYAFGQSAAMDSFVYRYNPNSNQLNWVDDLAGASLFTNMGIDPDVDNSMDTLNYSYDEIGQLISDIDEGISSIEWTVTNKVKKITKNSGTVIQFDYDAMGNRIAKHEIIGIDEKISTYYILDAQGNTMSAYKINTGLSNNLYLTERNIYGSSRLGQEQLHDLMTGTNYTYDLLKDNLVGDKRYELSNHLGNVLEVVTDVKLPVNVLETTLFNDQFNITGNTLGWLYDEARIGYPPPTNYSLTATGGELVLFTGLSDGAPYAMKKVFLEQGVDYTFTFDITSLSSSVGVIYRVLSETGFLSTPDAAGSIGTYSQTVTGNGEFCWLVLLGYALADNQTVKFDNIKLTAANTPSYVANVISYSDYYPYGMLMPGRHGQTADGYRYGFNGMEADDEVKTIEGSSYDFGARMFDPRVGRFLSRDGFANKFPSQSPYVFAGNTPIQAIDLNGNYIYFVQSVKDENGNTKQVVIKAKNINDLKSIIGMELLYKTKMGKAEINSYLNSKENNIYIAVTNQPLVTENGKSANGGTAFFDADVINNGDGFDNEILNDKVIGKHFEIFNGIKLDETTKTASYVVINERTRREFARDEEGNYILDDQGNDMYVNKPMENSSGNQWYQALTIFHEIRAHITYAIQGVIGGIEQHKLYGETNQDDMSSPNSDADKIKQELNNALEIEGE